ncbi:hypothetical protein HYN48_00775 [Flavobacterium magnum]|uniref:DUF4157 domain-containing protein n=1 Tax=Flavobacterium magnum TaxID=2162713 RepID=A0A2S0RBZ1_9FLAO|nr:hypothetical protein HYN48_00775 [Flavobacterium magnum]
MFIVTSQYLIPRGYASIAIFPFIIIGRSGQRQNKVLINHERIHIRQQMELLVVGFFIWYGFEYLIRLCRFRNHQEAYKKISFEAEAYANEHHPGFLQHRNFWNFIKYL